MSSRGYGDKEKLKMEKGQPAKKTHNKLSSITMEDSKIFNSMEKEPRPKTARKSKLHLRTGAARSNKNDP